MSMVAIPFAVDLSKVKNVFACKDRELLEQIKTAHLYDHYANDSDDFPDDKYNYNFDQLLEDILFNYIKPEDRRSGGGLFGLFEKKATRGFNENLGHGYGYVLLVICDYLGTHLMPHCDGFYYGGDFEAAVAIMKEKGLQLDLADMFEPHEVFDIPKIADFPAIRVFTKQEIRHVNDVMKKIDIDDSKLDPGEEDFDELQDLLKDIKDSFKTCQDQDVEMITFTH